MIIFSFAMESVDTSIQCITNVIFACINGRIWQTSTFISVVHKE